MDVLTVTDLSNMFWVCFFVGFGLYLSVTLIATMIHFVKDILISSV